MMRGERCTLWHGRHTKEARTSQGAQSRLFRVSHHYHAGCLVPQGNGISLMVDSSSFLSVSSSSSLDVSDEQEEEADEEDESESVHRLVAFGWP